LFSEQVVVALHIECIKTVHILAGMLMAATAACRPLLLGFGLPLLQLV